MNRKTVCLILALVMLVPFILAGCSDDDPDITGKRKKPLTFTLYGITGDSTTEEAIKAVEDEINLYTEGKFNTHIILRLYPESEYYSVLESKLTEIEKRLADEKAEEERKKQEARELAKLIREGKATKAPETEPPATETEAVTDAETYVEHGVVKSVFPEEKNTQVDIFMVRTAGKVQQYYERGWITSLNEQLAGSQKVLNSFISKQRMALVTLEGTSKDDGTVDKGYVYGIPNNSVVEADYTYLLIRKEIADRYSYSQADVDTLAELQYFLQDAARDYPEYTTLYNDPVIGLDYITDEPSVLGGLITQTTNAFTRTVPRDILTIPTYRTFLQYRYDWRNIGFTEQGDYYSAPEDKVFAAAFLKGDSKLPEQYEEDYYVINYLNPVARASEYPGTTFCVSAYASNVDRCMEIIASLETVQSFRDTFQYGVEGVHYRVNEYTGLVDYINHDYMMNPADTGNMFIMTPNSEMSEKVLALAENGWEKAKLEARDVIISPFCMFDLRDVTEDNYKTVSRAWAQMYNEAFEAAKKAENFDASKFTYDAKYPYKYTADMISRIVELGKEAYQKIDEFVEYTDEEGNKVTISDYARELRTALEKDEMYVAYIDTGNLDAPYIQYTEWYKTYGLTEEY